MTHETLPLSKIHVSVLEFLQGRKDVVLFRAHAVNAYVAEPRMNQDVDLLSDRAEDFKGFRIYQKRKEGNRHLVDVGLVNELPETQTIEEIQILTPAELIASKIVSYQSRKGKPKAGTDWRDLAFLLLKFPDLKTKDGKVFEILRNRKTDEKVF
jgi:hypothetical protein